MTSDLGLFAAAVAGRPVPLEGARCARAAYTDGHSIFLDEAADVSGHDLRRAVMAQATLIRSGSLDRAVLRKLARHGRPVVDRYLVLELARSVERAEAFLPRSFVAEFEPFARGGTSASAAESFRRARGVEDVAAPLPWFGELRPTAVLRTAAHPPPGGLPADLQAAAELADQPDADDAEEASGGRSRIMELLSAPMRNPLGDALQRMLGMGRSAGDGGGGAEMPISGRRSGRVGPNARVAPAMTRTRVTMGGSLVVGARHPEWDVHRSRYREDWCLVGEFDPASADPSAADAGGPVSPSLLRELARLGLAAETHRGETTGDGLDLTALVDLRTRWAAGEGGEPAIHTSHRRTAQRLGVLVLLDATGSTAEEADGREVFERQRTLARELTGALDRLGVRVATYAFYSNGRANTRFLRCKTFDEPWGLAARRRLHAVRPGGFTRLGAAVRHASRLLAATAGTEQQLLVVIGDGVAYDDGYEGTYAVADSRRAILEAGDRGIAVAGLSVAALDRDRDPIWPEGQHRVVEGAHELAGAARELFGTTMRRARTRT